MCQKDLYYCIFMLEGRSIFGESANRLAANLSSGQRLRCLVISPCPLEMSAAYLSTP